MVEVLEIKNFKSIKHLKLNCRRINIFIGKPNTGKSNILEAVGIFSFGGYFGILKDFVRFEKTSNLFYDENLEEKIEIRFDDKILKLWFDGFFLARWWKGKEGGEYLGGETGDFSGIPRTYEGVVYGEAPFKSENIHALSPFKFYRFAIRKEFELDHRIKEKLKGKETEFLLPPSGDNLLLLLLKRKELINAINQFFSPFGLRLGLRPLENKIEVIKQWEDVIISYPYSLTSETLQRLIFYFLVIETNKDSIIAFEEPEAHAFPFYVEYLAERIALLKNNNQYFISTHNPYFLLPILEKSPKDEVNVFITYFEDYQTKAKALTEKEKEEIMETDVFSNIDKFLGTE